jgi:hypothetical protein
MNIYHYHPNTQQLIAAGVADSSPLEPGKWLVPAHATELEPPASVENKTIHFMDGAWVFQDIPVPVPELPPSPPTPEQIKKEFVNLIQSKLDNFAKERGYEGILSACTYATSLVTKFKAEGKTCVNLRDSTWAAAYDILAQVEAGTRPMPSSIADIEADLPALVWAS